MAWFGKGNGSGSGNDGSNARGGAAADPLAVLEAFAEFVNGKGWEASLAVLEARRQILLTLDARLIVLTLIGQAEEEKMRDQLIMHAMVLEVACERGVDGARRWLADHSRGSAANSTLADSSTQGSSGSGSRPSGASGSLATVLAHLSPEERRMVEEQLQRARQRGDN